MLARVIKDFEGTMTQQEMVEQEECKEGAFYDAMETKRRPFINETENVEILTAFHLADFRFPTLNPELCFEMRADFYSDAAISYEDIVAGIENNTAIDCSIKADGQQFSFQIKRYPQKYLAHMREALTEFIKKIIFEYGDMKGIILVLILQSNTEDPIYLSLKQVHEDMVQMKDQISFDEIGFIFDDRGRNMRWEQVYPAYSYAEIPFK